MPGAGWPTPTDRVNRQIIWDIKKRDLPAGQVSTFSENADEAKLHTDTQYFPNPERYTLLYVVRPAEDGGVSLIRDGHHIVNSLKNGSQGDWAFRHLSRTKLPSASPPRTPRNAGRTWPKPPSRPSLPTSR